MSNIDYLSRIEFMRYHINNTQSNRDLIRSFGMRITSNVKRETAPHLVLFLDTDGNPIFIPTHGLASYLIPDDLVEDYLALIAIRSEAVFQFVEDIIKPRINA